MTVRSDDHQGVKLAWHHEGQLHKDTLDTDMLESVGEGSYTEQVVACLRLVCASIDQETLEDALLYIEGEMHRRQLRVDGVAIAPNTYYELRARLEDDRRPDKSRLALFRHGKKRPFA